MANTVIAIKKSATPAAVPTTLANGELAINFADGVIYYKNVSGGIASISGGYSFGTVNAGGTLLVSDTAGDVLDIRRGDNIIITGDAINDRMTINADLTAANAWSNTKLSNGTVTLAGALTTTGQIFANAQITLSPLAGGGEGGQIDILGSDSYPDWSIDSYFNDLRFFTLNSGIQQITFFNAGGGSVEMGINRGDPGYTLDVVGTINATAILVNGSPISGSGGSMDYAYVNAVGTAGNSYAASLGGGAINVSTMGPTGNTNGSLWWNSNLGRLFIYYTDGDSNQWVEASPSSGSIDVELLQSYTNVASDLAKLAFNQSNTAYTQANVAYTQANVAYTQANTKLTNTSVTLNGSLTTTGAVIDYKGDVRDIPPNDRTASMPYTITLSDTGKMVLANGNTVSSANVFVPNNVFFTGNTLMITNISTNTVTITQNSGVTMFLAGTNLSGNRTLSGRGIATLICIGANNFIISGAGVN